MTTSQPAAPSVRTNAGSVGGLTPLLTPWGETIDQSCPLNDYPRPQLRRDQWQCLNGPWSYAIRDDEGHPEQWDGQILVPYSPESQLSGVGRQLKPGQYLWYRRQVTWQAVGPAERRLLHFGAVDQRCRVLVNSVEVGRHAGGYWPFSCDVTEVARPGENQIEVVVQDDSDQGIEAYGKQKLERGQIWYTAQSGIWQTVWSEVVPAAYVDSLAFDIDCATDTIRLRLTPSPLGAVLAGRVEIVDGQTVVASAELRDNQAEVVLPGARRWSPDVPFLYDVRVTAGHDRVASYVGVREFGVERRDGRTYPTLNGQPILHNGLLDQGYWSDGLYTAPSDEAMVWELSQVKALGFNMLRKHIKIEPLRWYYHCDRLGLLVWQDFVSGGGPYHPAVIQVAPFLGIGFSDGPKRYGLHGRSDADGRAVFRRDMVRTVELLRNVVSLCVWVPFNEGWGQFEAAAITAEVRDLDPSRLIDHASGYFDQGAGDFHSYHIYFRHFRPKPDKVDPARVLALTEFGGYSLPSPGHMSSDKEFGYKLFRSQLHLDQALQQLYETDVLARFPDGLSAIVYTQVSDVEDEINGLFTYDRRVTKPDPIRLAALNQRLYEAFNRLL